MKILIFSLSYDPLIGGAEIAIKEITNRIPLEEMEFDMVTLRFSRKHPPFERVGNINVYRIGGGLGYVSKILFPIQAALFAARRSVAAPHQRFDLYWSMMTYMLFPTALLRLGGDKTANVLTLQDGDPFEHVFWRWYIRPFTWLLSYGFDHVRKIQTISTFLAEWARKAGAKSEIVVIPNGVNFREWENLHPHATGDIITLITTSRLVPKNAVGDVIEALKFMPENYRFQILGIGPLEKELKQKAERLGVSHRVEFKGFVAPAEVPGYLHQADIFIRPSLSEGMGNSFIEAMAAGLPVIATPVGGIPDFLKDGETGLFVDPRNPRQIAFQAQKLISDRVLRDKIVIAAKRMVVERYEWDLIAEEMKASVFAKV